VICKEFEYVILVFIIFSSIQLCLENPLSNPEGNVRKAARVVDIIVTIIFVMEAVLKIFSFGFIFCGPTSYMRNGWNILDFSIVMVSTLSLSGQLNLGIFKVLRLFRVLRPLKMISRNEFLKISISSLFYAAPQIANVILILFLFLWIFGIIGVNLLKGLYFRCEAYLDHADIFTKWDCVNFGGSWTNNGVNYDSIIEGFISGFGMSNTVGWADTMYKGIASRGIDLQPEQGFNYPISLYYIIFIIFGSFFVVNLFVGVVISSYNRQKDKLGNNFLLTNHQKQWVETQIMIISSKPKLLFKKPDGCFRSFLFQLVSHSWFDRFILFVIILNTVVLMVNHLNEAAIVTYLVETINIWIAYAFTLEAVLKITAYGTRYFKMAWNVFDFIVVVLSLLSMLLGVFFENLAFGPIAIVVRSVKIGRVIKLARTSSSVKAIYDTFIIALPGMLNIGSLLLLFIYIYSIMGNFLFAEVKLNGALGEHANF
jgi:hypothetical protein